MKVIALANGGFALPTLCALRDSRHELAAIVAMPDRTRNKDGGKGTSPVRLAMRESLSKIPFYDPDNVNSPEGVALIRSLGADLFFICDYGRILSKEIIESTKYGGVNLHGSLLPKYRGAAPINRSIQAGERELGVSVIWIEPKVDAGPILEMESYVPSLEDTAVEIEEQLSRMGAPLVIKAIDKIEAGTAVALPQRGEEATKAPKLRKEEGRIDWTRSSLEILHQYRAFQPWPRTYADWVKAKSPETAPVRLILGPFALHTETGESFILDEKSRQARSGEILKATGKELWIRTGDGAIRALAVQPAGRKNMPVDSFLRGYPLAVGDCLL